MKAVVDNDILLKAACYGLLAELVAAIPGDDAVGVLRASEFVVIHYLKEQKLNSTAEAAEERFRRFLAGNEVLEPTTEEQELAASLELLAQELSVGLDVGESQLVAILIVRLATWFATGDKRAIAALEQLLARDVRLSPLVGRIICLEQLVKTVATADLGALRHAICGEPEVDKTLTICFSCRSPEIPAESALGALDQHIADLRMRAPQVLTTS